ncbi:hypothetical protein KAFR_0G03380 [Kazachstania africana CBS 2517]|uniref:GATA-type domain-containing protein n=1 Tax=Kazachstania africana (strain ATCC 22294 / BCRC 22015 / CBS 2517 / CECT 1963 / NBRC 1671 / NRRL Y-8276) TaxID=1071382 RepID=H2AYC0_KAZAF|nr:hypothetical protein KAFR_0G03380 [Kazachstania africana CBS 2517]CCF59370.1 hypothetical protein KAFR_0G03380 [Kazachstania africana CBS 2517]
MSTSIKSTYRYRSSSAGPGIHKSTSFFDNLLLLPPRIPNKLTKKTHNNGSKSQRSYKFLSSSVNVSPVLPPINVLNTTTNKSLTAPASPHHFKYSTQNYETIITPSTSPEFSKAQLAFYKETGSSDSEQASLSLLNLGNVRDTNLNSVNLLTQLNKKTEAANIELPSLKHLKLLPDPKIQESSSVYPDTSVKTKHWKNNLVDYCRNENYEQFKKIDYENLSGTLLSLQKEFIIPSVLKPMNQFEKFFDDNGTVSSFPYLFENEITPVTPPMSPRRSSVNKSPQCKSTTTQLFTPFVSEKLVNTVKEQIMNTPSTPGHKKTNSFKALQLKKLLSNRDVLSKTSKKVTKKNTYSWNKLSSTLSSPTFIGTNRHVIMKISNTNIDVPKLSSSPALSPTASPNASPRTTTGTRRSKTPPRYHKFPIIESPPQSPVRHYKKKTSNGTSTTTSTRECVSCHTSDSPCWRPSWSPRKQDQLCNSCGLRYKKTRTRCLNDTCRKIPTKSELNIMKSNGLEVMAIDGITQTGFRCLFCNHITETRRN